MVPILALLMFLRAQGTLVQLVTDVWASFEHGDIPPLIFVGGRVARIGAEVVFLNILTHLLERLVSIFIFIGLVQC